MLCRVRPYDGTEPFLFFSYCRKNADEVYPIIEQMVCDGYRIWYDDGIKPGDDWLEVIADHLHRSHAVIVALTEEAAQSHNCRNEMNFAMEFHKPVVSVLLKDFAMPKALKLQLGITQYMRKYEFAQQAAFYEALYRASCMADCRGPKQVLDRKRTQMFEEEQLRAQEEKGKQQLLEQKQLAKAALEVGDRPEKASPPADADEQAVQKPISLAEENVPLENREEPVDRESCTDEAAALQAEQKDMPCSPEPPVAVKVCDDQKAFQADQSKKLTDLPETADEKRTEQKDMPCAMLVHVRNGRRYLISKAVVRIGRMREECDLSFPDNKKMSRHHADILFLQGRYYLLDQKSLNHVYINGVQLEEGEQRELRCFDEIMMAQEQLFFVSDAALHELMQAGTIAFLRREHGVERLWIENGNLILGRSQGAEGNGLADIKISRKHAEIRCYGTHHYIKDLGSTNGTFVNEHRLAKGQECLLKNMDMLRLGDTSLQFVELALR